WSDRVTTRFGRRRPFMVAGVLLGIVGLFVMMTAHSYAQLVTGHVIAQIFLNGAAAAYYAIIPDIVPDAEFGKASGFLAGMQQGGGLLGFVITFVFGTIHQTRLSFVVMAGVLLLSLVPVLWASGSEGRRPIAVARRGAARGSARDFLRPLWTGDFGWVIALRALYGIGYGLFLAVDWAVACDTIPDRAKAAKDMGLFHVAQTLPNSIIPAIEGSLIDTFNKHVAPNSGYRVAFGSVIL